MSLTDEDRQMYGWEIDGQWMTTEQGVIAFVTAERNRLADEIEAESSLSSVSDDVEEFYRAGMRDAARIVRPPT